MIPGYCYLLVKKKTILLLFSLKVFITLLWIEIPKSKISQSLVHLHK